MLENPWTVVAEVVLDKESRDDSARHWGSLSLLETEVARVDGQGGQIDVGQLEASDRGFELRTSALCADDGVLTVR